MAHRYRGRRRPRRRIPPSGKPPTPQGRTSGRQPAGAVAPAAPAAKQKDPLIGRTLGRCTIEAAIGQGRTSRVYRAHHQGLDATVAVKVLLPDAAAKPRVVESFMREARALAKIDNENVLKIYDVASEGDVHYIVMELLDGEEVLDLIRREERIDVMDALRIVRQAANGLATAHAQHIIHRDVKPQNLVLLEDGTVKVVDFGLAVAAGDEGSRVGTPHYMAPEVCKAGQAEVGSDVYALGIVLYHLLVGQPPHAGKDVPAILRAHIQGEPLHPERRRAGLPREVGELVRRLTKADPISRPSAAEVVQELDDIGGKALKEKSTLRRRRARGRARAAARSANSAAIIAGIVVLGGIGLVIAMGSGGDEGRPSRPTQTETSTTGGTAPEPTPPVEPGGTPTTAPPEVVEAALQAQQEREARELLESVESWARTHWFGPSDTQGVVDRYRDVRAKFPDTVAGKEADSRARRILGGNLHPHPDKEYSAQDAVEAARDEWEELKPKILALIAETDYFSARNKVPAPVQDVTGQIQRELGFWRTYLDHLVAFKVSAVQLFKNVPEEDRVLTTPEGRGTVREVTGDHFRVRVSGVDVNLPWKDADTGEIMALATKAFRETGATRNQIQLMAFAFANDLWDEFSAVNFELEFAGGAGDYAPIVREFKERFQNR